MRFTSDASGSAVARLGPAETWPPHLSAAHALVLDLPHPAALVWGPRAGRTGAMPEGAPESAEGRRPLVFVPNARLEALAPEGGAFRRAVTASTARVLETDAPLREPPSSFADPRPGLADRMLGYSLTPLRASAGARPDGVLLLVHDETEALQRESYEREQLFSVVAHDLKNPLNVVALSTYQLGMLPVPPELRDRTKKLSDAIKRATRRINDLVSDMLDLVHLDLGPLTLDTTAEDATKLVNEAVEYLAPVAQQKSVLLDVKVEPGLRVQCDKERFARVLASLGGDAITATPQHGMVRVSAIGEGALVLFEVHDMGPGVPEGELTRLFDRRAAQRKDERRKLGRALPLAKATIEAQGGWLRVESPSGLGTLVRFTLPSA